MIKGETYSDSKTFASLTTAKTWERKRLAELDGTESVAVLETEDNESITIQQLIQMYLKKSGKMGRSKLAVSELYPGQPYSEPDQAERLPTSAPLYLLSNPDG